jgi:hypothetical protein
MPDGSGAIREETAVYERELAFDLAGKDYAGATDLIARYRKAFPQRRAVSGEGRGGCCGGRGSAKDGLAVFDRSFEPLWPAELVKSYYALLESGHQTLKVRDALRARLAACAGWRSDALKDAARLFYIFQQQGQLEAAKAVLAGYRERKDARGAAWSADELYTLGGCWSRCRIFPRPRATTMRWLRTRRLPMQTRKGLAGLVRICFTAPEQPLRVGAGNSGALQKHRDDGSRTGLFERHFVAVFQFAAAGFGVFLRGSACRALLSSR